MQDLVVNERLTIPSRELRWRFSRSSGPGGQGVNTTCLLYTSDAADE